MTRRGATRGTYAIAGFSGALYFAARTTGAGWLMVILCVLVAVLVIGIVWPRLALIRVRLDATGPTDAVAGDPLTLDLRVTNPGLGVRIRPVDPPGAWTAALASAPSALVIEPPHRGVLTRITVEVSSAAPFGLVWWRRLLTAPLGRPVDVAPRRGEVPHHTSDRGVIDGATPTHRATVGGDTIRSIREHRPGDSLRMVHWPATARHGSLLVKELDQPERPRLTVLVDLRGDADASERAAEHAMGVICDALEAGIEVTVASMQVEGPVSTRVTSPLDAGRRLARTVTTAAPSPPPGDRAVVVVSARGTS